MTIKEFIEALKASHNGFKVTAKKGDLVRVEINTGEVLVDGWFKKVEGYKILRLETIDGYIIRNGHAISFLEMDKNDIGGLITETNQYSMKHAFINAISLYDYKWN